MSSADFKQQLARKGLTLETAPAVLGIHPTVLRQLVLGPKEVGGLRPTWREFEKVKQAVLPGPVDSVALPPVPSAARRKKAKLQAEQGDLGL